MIELRIRGEKHRFNTRLARLLMFYTIFLLEGDTKTVELQSSTYNDAGDVLARVYLFSEANRD